MEGYRIDKLGEILKTLSGDDIAAKLKPRLDENNVPVMIPGSNPPQPEMVADIYLDYQRAFCDAIEQFSRIPQEPKAKAPTEESLFKILHLGLKISGATDSIVLDSEDRDLLKEIVIKCGWGKLQKALLLQRIKYAKPVGDTEVNEKGKKITKLRKEEKDVEESK